MDEGSNESTASATVNGKPPKGKAKAVKVKAKSPSKTAMAGRKAKAPSAEATGVFNLDTPAPASPVIAAENVTTASCKVVAERFRNVADPTRMAIIMMIEAQGKVNVTEMCNYLDSSQPAISHHTALMRHCGLIEFDRVGKHNFYKLTALGRGVAEIIRRMVLVS